MPRKSQQPARRYASVKVAAEIYDVNPRTVRRWINEGRITGYKIGAMLVKVDLNERPSDPGRRVAHRPDSRLGDDERG
jgi:predicted ATP-grasp superfamily ATP-dependent carboligase